MIAGTASANCYVDYKAKRASGDLELHYGVMQILQSCDNRKALKSEVAQRIAGDGWQLLRIMSSFDESQLQGKQADAGPYFLRY